jgi:hypothetical protein
MKLHPPELSICDPDERAVLEDWWLERGGALALHDTLCRCDGDGDGYSGYGYGDGGYGDGGYSGYGDGYGGYGDGYSGYGYGDGGGHGDGGYSGYGDGYGGYGDGDGGGHGDGDGGGHGADISRMGASPPSPPLYQRPEKEEVDMTEGLRICVVPGAAYVYVLVGWLKHDRGDEWLLYGARVIRRFGAKQALASLAKRGPAGDTELLEAADEPEPFHRLLIRRCIACNEAAWIKHCPRPKQAGQDQSKPKKQ